MSEMSLASTGKGVPQVFRTSSAANVVYDWADYLQNVGYKTYYLAKSRYNGDGTWYNPVYKRIITTQIVDSSTHNGITEEAYDDEDVYTKIIDESYDLEIGKNCVIGGNLIVNNTCTLKGVTTCGAFAYLDIFIYHVSSIGTETQIGNEQTSELYCSITTDLTFRQLTSISISETNFAKGDQFRVKIKAYLKTLKDGDRYYFKFYVDPSNEITLTDDETRTVGTDFKINVPFKIIT